MALPIIDARVHVGRTQTTYQQVRRALAQAGVDTALLCAEPESPQLSDDVTLPLDLARPDGPYACYYVGGNPFGGHRRGEMKVPRNFERYSALYLHCFLSPSHDFGGAVTSATISWRVSYSRRTIGAPNAPVHSTINRMTKSVGRNHPCRKWQCTHHEPR